MHAVKVGEGAFDGNIWNLRREKLARGGELDFVIRMFFRVVIFKTLGTAIGATIHVHHEDHFFRPM